MVANMLSLTSLLKTTNVKNFLNEKFPFEPFNIDADVLAPAMTRKYSAVGTAADYLIRWWLMRWFLNVSGRRWIAESAVYRIGSLAGAFVSIGKNTNGEQVFSTNSINSQLNFKKGCPEQVNTYMPLYETSARLLDRARSEYFKYLDTSIMTDDTLRAAFGLVGLDTYARSGVDVGIGAEPNNDDIDDLRQIWNVLDSGDLCKLPPECKILLNPTFGDGSALVKGADADIITCNKLIDIKTTKFGRFTGEHWRQLVGYWLLSLVGGWRGFDWKKIDRLGVYFSRHGRLELVPIPNMCGAELERTVDEFSDIANDYYGRKGKNRI